LPCVCTNTVEMIQLIRVRSLSGKDFKKAIELFVAPARAGEFFSYAIYADLIEFVNGCEERTLRGACVNQRCDPAQHIAVINANGVRVYAELFEHSFDHHDDFHFAYQRVGTHDVGVALIELAVSSLLRTVGAPARMHLVPPERKGYLVPVHNHVAGKWHGEVVAKALFRDGGRQGF